MDGIRVLDETSRVLPKAILLNGDQIVIGHMLFSIRVRESPLSKFPITYFVVESFHDEAQSLDRR